MGEKAGSILDIVLLIFLGVCCLRERGGISSGPTCIKRFIFYEGCESLGLTDSKMRIELICSGTLKRGFINNYIAVVKKMLKKTKNMFLMVLFSRTCTDLLTFHQGSAWIAPKSSIKFSFQSVTPVKQRKNGK